jgi:hypothetical protein
MGWSGVPTITAVALAVLATAAQAQPSSGRRYNGKFVEASFSTNDVLGRSLAHAAVASTDLRRPDTQLSRADLFGLMILVSMPNKQK